MIAARRALLVAALVVAAWPQAAVAQFGMFGPNKVHYRRLDWRVLRGEHVDLFYYPEEEELARVALTYAEESYRVLEAAWRLSVPERIPLIVYASHSDFEQTNLLPFVPPEGLLGFTEFGRSRVALPFRGSYQEFRHTIRHELVHVFQLARRRLNADVHPRVGGYGFPLWFGEGSAEYWSAGEDPTDEMILRDLTMTGRLPSIRQLEFAGGGIVYAIGGALVRFLAERYGDWRLIQAYDDAWQYQDFHEMLAGVFGTDVERLTAEWHYAMRRRYYPGVQEQRPLAIDAHQVAGLAIKPAVWTPPGDSLPLVFYLSSRTGYTEVYARPLHGGEERTVVRGERSAQFESFHPFDSRIDISDPGILVFGSKYMDRDALFFWDLNTDRVIGRYQFPEIVSVLSPAWRGDGGAVVFSGLSSSGYSDLYLLEVPSGRLERLTTDRFEDSDPSFSPDGTRVVFASDRAPGGADGATNLYVMDLATRRLRPLTAGQWRDAGPRWDRATDRITFTSDRRGVQDIYVVDSTGLGRRESGVPGGTFDPVWVPAARRYVFGGFENLQFGIYSLRRPPPDSATRAPGTELIALADSATPAAAVGRPEDVISLAAGADSGGSWRWGELDEPRYQRTEPARYDRRFKLDFAGAEAAFTPGAGGAQGATFLLSDMLADHLVMINILTFQQAGSISDIFSNFNGYLTYLNQTRRLNWGAGAFRLRGTFYEGDYASAYNEESFGVYGLLRYPLSRFTRVQARFQVEYSDRTDFGLSSSGVAFPSRQGFLTSNFLTYVRDNSLWLATGPIDGGRLAVTGGLVADMANARFDSWLMSVDVRRYLRTGLQTAFALRGFVYMAGGERSSRVTLGGSYGLRGYPRYNYVAGPRAWMFNGEWRFPLTDYLSFGFPFGEARFPGVQGAFFADAARAWSPQGAKRGILGSFGGSLRMGLYPLVLRLDIGWRYGDQTGYALPLSTRQQRFVDFWFGFNY